MTSKYPLLFQPAFLGPLHLRNRLVMAPLGTNLAGADGAVTPELIVWYRERSRGGVGLIIVENTLADVRFGRGLARQLRIDHAGLTPGLSELAEAVQAEGAKIAIQINIQGAGVDAELSPGVEPVGPSAISYIFDRSGPGSALPARMRKEKRVRALTRDEMKELRDSFARAAGIARSAGFDAIELHGAHGYLLAGFLSPFSNQRTDEYGGGPEGRIKFVLEVYHAVREQVGPEFPVLFRMSGREYLQGGREIEESQWIAQRLDEAGITALDVSAGISMEAASYTWMNPPATFPQGAFMADAGAIRKAVQVPVIGVGKIRDPSFAEKIIGEDQADFVALGRPLIADPEWPLKAEEGREREIRRCISCNRCLRIMYRLPIRCAVNARAGRERDYPLAPAPRSWKVAVAGGGPAGMEAARAAAERGHRVTLFEKESSLGGQLRLAVVPPFKTDLALFLSYLKIQAVEKAEVRLNEEVTPGTLLGGGFDFVILASGAVPLQTGSPRIGSWEVLSGKVRLKSDCVAILGKGRVACETAELLALRRKKKVTLIHSGPLEEIGSDLEPIFERRLLMERLQKLGVNILPESRVVEITPEGVRVEGRESGFIPCDHVILDQAPLPCSSLMKELEGKIRLIVVGDGLEPGDLYKAIHEGFHAGYSLPC